MKYIVTFFYILTFSCSLVKSQAVLTFSNNCPVIGDLFNTYTADTTGVLPGGSGASQTWDFSSLNISTVMVTDSFFNASTSPYFSSFPTANLASTGANSVGGMPINFYQNSTSESIALGYYVDMGAQSYVLAYTDPVLTLTYPFTYNSLVNDNSSGSYVTNSLTNVVTQTTSTAGDAWGTLILPGHTFNNVLRVKTITNTETVMGGMVTTYFTGTVYSWFDGVHKAPILSITISTQTILSSVLNNKKVVVADYATGISEFPIDFPISVYPNPTQGIIMLDLNKTFEDNISVTISDLAGRVLRNEIFNNATGQMAIDLTDFNRGTYIVKVQTTSGCFSNIITRE